MGMNIAKLIGLFTGTAQTGIYLSTLMLALNCYLSEWVALIGPPSI